MFFLIITFGFMLALRGAKPAPLQKPVVGLVRTWREALDLLLTISLILIMWAGAMELEKIQAAVREYAILIFGISAYLLSRSQKKTDVFFLAVIAIVFKISSEQADLVHGLFLACAVSGGIALFQTCFLGLRYKLLFSRVPASMKGWPVLCLLAAFIALVLKSLVF